MKQTYDENKEKQQLGDISFFTKFLEIKFQVTFSRQ